MDKTINNIIFDNLMKEEKRFIASMVIALMDKNDKEKYVRNVMEMETLNNEHK